MTAPVRVALLGCGNVGQAFVELLERERPRIQQQHNTDVEVTAILVRDLAKRRAPPVDPNLLTKSAMRAIDGDSDLVVELIGGVHSAGAYVRRALSRRKSVVTANKALLANYGSAMHAAADRNGVRIAFEASVCGCIPIVRVLREGLRGDRIRAISGVINGTCNFVLSRMAAGESLPAAIVEAQRRGFAEADPSLDVRGIDAEQKIRILSDLGFREPVVRSSVLGIDRITRDNLARAADRGATIRLVAEAKRVAGGVEVSVSPREVPLEHPFAQAEGEENVVCVEGDAIGSLYLRGKGAGPLPTAAAVLGDVIELAREGGGEFGATG